MLNAHTIHPHTSAVAAWSGMRVGGSLTCVWLPGMVRCTARYPIDRGVSR